MEAIKRKRMVFSIEDIKERIPHRQPFLMIDRVLEQSPGKCVALKNVTINEQYFNGHFPGQAIMPGALITEAMAQATAFVGTGEDGDGQGVKKGFVILTNVKMQKPVIPGDQLIIKANFVKKLGKLLKFRCSASVDGDIVASGEINVAEIE